jgi:hypothetical protein
MATPTAAPLQTQVIDDLLLQLATVTEANGCALTLRPREPESVPDDANNAQSESGACLVYDLGDEGGGDPDGTSYTQQRQMTVRVEVYAVAPQGTQIRRLLRHVWGDCVRVICANYGQRVPGVLHIAAGDVLILPDDAANAGHGFFDFLVSLEHLSNDPSTPR